MFTTRNKDCNPYAATQSVLLRTTLRFSLIIHSHNFGKISGDLGQSVLNFSFSKSISGPGQLSLQLAPDVEWLDLVAPNDYVNFYVNISTGEEDIIYNRGWVRIFFGLVNDIRRVESVVSEHGAISVRYSLSATDIYKVLAFTTIYNHPAIPESEVFGRMIVGIASSHYRLGLQVAGSPRFLLMNNLYAFLGYGAQWVLPADYREHVGAQAKKAWKYRGESVDWFINQGTVNQFAESRVRNDILKSIQEKRQKVVVNVALRKSKYNARVITDQTKYSEHDKKNQTSFAQMTVGPSALDFATNAVDAAAATVNSATAAISAAKTVIKQTQEMDVSTAGFLMAGDEAARLGISDIPPSYAQLTPDISAPIQPINSILDIISMDYMEFTEGWCAKLDLWGMQGSLLNLIDTLVNPVMNEFFYDLRPTIDFLSGSDTSDRDGLGHQLDGGLVLVPSFVLREYPFNYAKGNESQGIDNRIINLKSILTASYDFARTPLEENRFWIGDNSSAVERYGKQNPFSDDNNTWTKMAKIFYLDPGGSVWCQKQRVVDYGKVLGFNFDAFWEEGVGYKNPSASTNDRYRDLMYFNRGPRTLEHIEITSNDVKSSNLGRGDQDLVTAVDCAPISNLSSIDFRAHVREYSPQFRMLLIRRHGLRLAEYRSMFVDLADAHMFAYSERYKASTFAEGIAASRVADGETFDEAKNTIDFDVPGIGKIPSEHVFSDVMWYMNIKIVIMRDMWDQHNSEYLNGSLVLRAMPGIRVGYRLDWIDRDLSFYVVEVNHSGAFGGIMETTVAVTRGQPLYVPLDHLIPDNRVSGEESNCFKLGMPFSVANPSGGVNRTTGRRLQEPGKPGYASLSNLFQNWKRTNIKISYADGVNTGSVSNIVLQSPDGIPPKKAK